MEVQKEKTAYQAPIVDIVTINLSTIIAVSPGGGEGTGNENWIPEFPLSKPSVFDLL